MPLHPDKPPIRTGNIWMNGNLYITGNINLSSLADNTSTRLITASSSGLLSALSLGNSGQVLQSTGTGLTWVSFTSGQVYKGTWDASSNTPTLSNGSGTVGWYYRCTTAGTFNSVSYSIGDDISYNGSTWERIPGQGYNLQIATSLILGGVKIGSGVTVQSDGTISVSTNYQAPITGTGFVKSTAGTISYDTNTYLTSSALSGYATENWVINNYVSLNDYRLSDARIASDVYGWAKQSVKPTYTYTEVGAAASGHTHSGTYEPVLGTPSVSGYVLSSTTNGVRSWVPMSTSSGTVTSITAGTGLTGGTITTSGTIGVNFGTTSGTVAYGNHTHDYSNIYATKSSEGKVRIQTGSEFGEMDNSQFSMSGGVVQMIIDTNINYSSYRAVTNNAIANALNGKQDNLTSGINIKTINSTSVLGSGNFSLAELNGDLTQPFRAFDYSIQGGYSMEVNGGMWGVYYNNSWVLRAGPTGALAEDFTMFSDIRLKNNIQNIDNVDWVDNINLVNFTMKSDISNRKRYGVIAQQIENIAPELVTTDSDGIKAVSYTDLLIAKVARLEQLINKLENKIKILENE